MMAESLRLNTRHLKLIACPGIAALALFASLLSMNTPAQADPGWIVTRDDFRSEPVTLQALDESGLRVLPVGQTDAVTIAPDSFLQIERAAPGRFGQGKFTLMLLNGDRIAGEPVGLEDEHLLWRSPAVGEMKIPLKQASALTRAGTTIGSLEEQPTEDKVYLNNGDSAKGIITDLAPGKVTIHGVAPLEIPIDSVRWIQFALATHASEPPGRAFRVHLNDDSFITVPAARADAENLSLTLADGSQRQLRLASVVGIEQLNGPVSWLSSRAAAQVVQIPYFGATAWPTRMDRTVDGKPIQFANRLYTRGIGVHAFSRIDYALDGSYEAFRTQFAIAQEDRRQYADVTVRIKLDGKTAHEQVNVKADVLSPVVVIELPRNARLLTLEVDYGQANDTQDRFNWIEPALLRKKPVQAAPPQTAPTTRNAEPIQ